MNSFAEEIMKQKYSHIKEDGTKETWEAVAANRVRAGFSPALPTTPSMRVRTGRFTAG